MQTVCFSKTLKANKNCTLIFKDPFKIIQGMEFFWYGCELKVRELFMLTHLHWSVLLSEWPRAGVLRR